MAGIWWELQEKQVDELGARASRGDVEALYELALFFQRQDSWDPSWEWRGESFYRLASREEDSAEVWPWLCRAAVLGHPRALFEAGQMFESRIRGAGVVEQDRAVAYASYSLAAQRGAREAEVGRSRVAPLLEPTERERANQLISSGRIVDACPAP